MRPLRALVIYILAVFVGGALLAPWLYFAAQKLVPKLAEEPFHRFVNRALLGIALLGLWPLVKNLGATSARDLGLPPPQGKWRNLGAGFLAGFLSLALLAGIILAAGARHLNYSLPAGKVVSRLLTAVGSAAIVAVLEEILFRGALFGSLRKAFHWRIALAISSAVYAMVHFLKSAGEPEIIHWYSGLITLGWMFGGFTDWQTVVPAFFNLLLAGSLLGLAYQRTGTIYFSIGLHAGWIFWLKAYGLLTTGMKFANNSNDWLWGTGKLINGWAALPILGGTLVIVSLLLQRRGSHSG